MGEAIFGSVLFLAGIGALIRWRPQVFRGRNYNWLDPLVYFPLTLIGIGGAALVYGISR